MPIYEFECEKGHRFDRLLKLEQYRDPQQCECGSRARKIITPTMINCDMQSWDSYISPVSGKLITSYKDRKRDMEEHGCVDYEPSLKKHVTKHMETEDAKLEKRMDETVEQLIESMPVRKKEKLESELNSGADCIVERR